MTPFIYFIYLFHLLNIIYLTPFIYFIYLIDSKKYFIKTFFEMGRGTSPLHLLKPFFYLKIIYKYCCPTLVKYNIVRTLLLKKYILNFYIKKYFKNLFPKNYFLKLIKYYKKYFSQKIFAVKKYYVRKKL